MPENETFTDEQQALLERFLADATDEGALSLPEAAGFLFAVAAAPEPVPAPDWMPFVLGEAAFDDEQQGKSVNRALRALLAWVDERAGAGEHPMPPGYEPARKPADNIGEESPLGQWSRGFTFGHQWLEDAWKDRVPESLEEHYGAAVLALSFFSARELAETCSKQAGAEDVASMADHILKLMPQARGIYFDLGRAIREALSEEGGGRRLSGDSTGGLH